MLGPLAVLRDGQPVALPSSRKLRALLAYLALSPTAVGRSRLCDLLWDLPNDPRGELRWCLSKLRRLLDDPDNRRVVTHSDAVSLSLYDCLVDAAAVSAAVEAGLERIETARLQQLDDLIGGDFLEGLEVDRCPLFENWLVAQRRRFRAIHADILAALAGRLPAGSAEHAKSLERRVVVSPLDADAQCALLQVLAARGQIEAGEEHLAAAMRLFASEGLNGTPLRAAWEAGKTARPAAVQLASTTGELKPLPELPAGRRERASLAVMPFTEQTASDAPRGGLADGLTHDVITRLAKLRDVFIIARGSVFALAERNLGPEEAGRALNVDYVASGTVRHQGDRVAVMTELMEVKSARILWADEFVQRRDDIFATLDEVGNRIVSSVSSEIEAAERNRAVLKVPGSLNAWEAYHRGLWHMYRFTRAENELAQQFFRLSLRLDPTFARAHAGLSFTHWQSAFQRWGDRESEGERAYEAAGLGVLSDDHDPAAHWAMGRALWIRGQENAALFELTRAVELSPNFALGHYALSFVQSQSGDPAAAISAADQSRHLSPFDPLMFGMLSARAMAHVRLGEFEEAAEWAVKAAARPNAHAIILAIAAHCLGLAGRIEEGRAFWATLRKTYPQFGDDGLLATFRFSPDGAALFREGARRIGLD